MERNTTTISKEYLKTLSNMGINFYSENEFNDFNQMLNNTFDNNNDNYISLSEFERVKLELSFDGKAFVQGFISLIKKSVNQNMSILFISSKNPLELNQDETLYSESKNKSFGKEFNGIFRIFENTFVINYDSELNFIDKVNMMIHESGHLYEYFNGELGHSRYFWKWYTKMSDLFFEFNKNH